MPEQRMTKTLKKYLIVGEEAVKRFLNRSSQILWNQIRGKLWSGSRLSIAHKRKGML
jgi:hypothetical protein